jgi:hypothetical protein
MEKNARRGCGFFWATRIQIVKHEPMKLMRTKAVIEHPDYKGAER